MPYQVLARKYRPLRFSDVVGQDHVTRTLLNALAGNRIAHGYIFSGHRGIGKTTIARILASALNCRTPIGSDLRPTPEPCNACDSCLEIRQGNAVDVIEIDAATNRGIDEIRELRDAARYRPSRDKYKIYILDEAHQITDAAFNALLKTLEEPPDHIVFMMATTQPEDIPQTIRSRCQHFSFHAVKLDGIVTQLRSIATAESISADDATLALLAEAGDGSMRDALSIMDQAIASAPLTDGCPTLDLNEVHELMGTVSNVVYEQILQSVHANNAADVLVTINRLLDAGNGAPQLARQFVRYLRNCTVAKITALPPEAEATGIAADLLQISPEERRRAARSASLFTEEELSRFLAVMLRTFDELGYRQEPRFHLELGLLKLVHLQRLLPVEDLLAQLGTAPPRPAVSRTLPAITLPTALTPKPKPHSSLPMPITPAAALPVLSPTSVSAAKTLVASSENVPAAPTGVPVSEHLPSSDSANVATPPSPVDPPLHIASTGLSNGGPDPRPPSVPSPPTAPDLAELQTQLTAILSAAKGQQSAGDALHDATLTLAGALPEATLEIHSAVSKTMLAIVFNAEAEKLLRSALRDAGHPHLKLKLLPGAPAVKPSSKKPTRAVAGGSAAELAEKHPMVQQARDLFSAEISNVIDLRET